MATKILPRFDDCKTKEEIKNAAWEWIEYLIDQTGIGSINNQDKFDFDNQLDDFENDEGEYYEVIQWIGWFFDFDRGKIESMMRNKK